MTDDGKDFFFIKTRKQLSTEELDLEKHNRKQLTSILNNKYL